MSEVSGRCTRVREINLFDFHRHWPCLLVVDPSHRVHASRTLTGQDRPSSRKNSESDQPRISHKSIPPSANNYVTRGSNSGDSAPFIFVIQRAREKSTGKKSRRRWFRLGDGESRSALVAEVIGESIKAGSTVVHRSRIVPPALPAAGWQQWKCSITRSLCN